MLNVRSSVSHFWIAEGVPAVSTLPPPPLVCQPEHQAVIAVAGLHKHIAELSYSHCCRVANAYTQKQHCAPALYHRYKQ